jgi:hypothetical protein
MGILRRAALTSLALGACSSKMASAPDATPPIDAAVGFQTAAHTPMPTVIKHSGKVIAHPVLVTITYADDTFSPMWKTLGDQIVTSTWLTTVGTEYGVGTGSHAGMYSIGPAPASIDGTTIQSTIQAKITDGTLPAPDASGDQHIYVLYVPRKVTLGNDLQNIYGYHAMGTAKGVNIAYAAILDPTWNTNEVPGITSTVAHELIEAATDPYDPPNDGWYTDPPLPDPWWLIMGEVGDLCDGEKLITSGDFQVQRSWSNAAAAAGKNPCIPEDPDDSWYDVSADPTTMPTIPAGGSATFTLTGWSTSQIADWSLQALTADYSDLKDTDMTPTFSATTINNGKTVTLTLHAPAGATSGQHGGVYVMSGDLLRPWAVGFTVK